MDFALSWSCPDPKHERCLRGMGEVACLRLGASVGREKEYNIH
jgi:hypothetical protein